MNSKILLLTIKNTRSFCAVVSSIVDHCTPRSNLLSLVRQTKKEVYQERERERERCGLRERQREREKGKGPGHTID